MKLNRPDSADSLSKRWLWPSHFHRNGSAESHLVSTYRSPTGSVKVNELMKRGKPACCLIQTAYGRLSVAAHGSTPSTSFAPLYQVVLLPSGQLWSFTLSQVAFVNTLLLANSSVLSMWWCLCSMFYHHTKTSAWRTHLKWSYSPSLWFFVFCSLPQLPTNLEKVKQQEMSPHFPGLWSAAMHVAVRMLQMF